MSHFAYQPGTDAVPLTMDAAMAYFAAGEKSPEQFRVGAEIEMFLVHHESLALCTFAEIEPLLLDLVDRYGWQPELEAGRVIALRRKKEVIALEPGGQLEYATPPVENLAALQSGFDVVFDEWRTIAESRGLNGLSLGQHPTANIGKIPLIPKHRYQIMAPRLAEVGPMSHYMMRGNCAWQCALDYKSSADFREKFRTAYSVTSLIAALFASGAWENGVDSGFASNRLQAWTQTDPARCGLIPEVFAGAFDFESYYRYALSVPMLFIMRDAQWINVRGLTFADFMARGYDGHFATLEDWMLHLTTLFPDVRLKQYIEIRGADAGRVAWACALPAIFWGLFSESSLMDAAQDLTRRLTFNDRQQLYVDVIRDGLAARVGRIEVRELVSELLAIASNGLSRHVPDESHVLQPVRDFIQRPVVVTAKRHLPKPTRESLREYLLW